MITRQWLDPVVEEIEQKTGIPKANILINCTHTLLQGQEPRPPKPSAKRTPRFATAFELSGEVT